MNTSNLLSNVITAWESFCFNYRSTQINWRGQSIAVPEFIFKAKWPKVDADYMCRRWLEEGERYNVKGSALVHIFFLGLDQDNKSALLRYANIIQE